MARRRRNRRVRQRPVRTKNRNSVRSSVPKPRKTTNSGTAPNFIVRGIRSLLSGIPGYNAIGTLADFLFTKSSIKSHRLAATGDVIGLNACIFPTMAACIRNSPVLARDADNIFTNYADSQLMMFSVTVEPINFIQKRSGSWAMTFTPFRTSSDYEWYVNQKTMPTYLQLLAHQGTVSGRADMPLTLTYRPTVKDGYIGLFMGIEDKFGMLCIAFQDEQRAPVDGKLPDFTPEEFAARVRLSAVVSLRSSTAAAEATRHQTKIYSMSGVETVTYMDGAVETVSLETQSSALHGEQSMNY